MALLPPNEAPPLRDDADVLQRVTDLVGRALVPRRLWVLLLDGDGYQLPTVPQFDELPLRPHPRTAANFGVVLAHLGEHLTTDAGDGAVVFVLERTGGGPTDDDWAWAQLLHDGAVGAGIAVRGVYLSSNRRVEALPIGAVG